MGEAKTRYSYQEIAELAEVPLKAVSNTIYRMKNGVVPKKGHPKKIADCLTSHSITLEMIGGGGSGKARVTKAETSEVAPEMLEISQQESDSSSGAFFEDLKQFQESDDTTTGQGEPVKQDENSVKPDDETRVTFVTYRLDDCPTEDLLRELKDRIPTATISISL